MTIDLHAHSTHRPNYCAAMYINQALEIGSVGSWLTFNGSASTARIPKILVEFGPIEVYVYIICVLPQSVWADACGFTLQHIGLPIFARNRHTDIHSISHVHDIVRCVHQCELRG